MNVKWIFGLVLASSIMLNACKSEGDLGINLVPDLGGDGVKVVDTISIDTRVMLDDSIRTRNTATQPLGFMSDNVYGRTQTSIFTQLRPTGEGVNFGTNLTLDSLVLALAIEGFYGDTTQELTLQVFEITQALSADSSYFSNTRVAISNVPFATFKYSPRPFSRVSSNEIINNVDSLTTLPAQLRIPLPESLALRFFAASGTSDLQNQANFLNFFKGLCVKATDASGKGVVINVNPTSLNSALSLYYKTNGQRRKFNFIITNELQRFSTFEHDYTGSTINQVLNINNHSGGDMYVQGLAGVKTFIKLPFINNFETDKVLAINKAELVFEVVNGTEKPPFSPPAELVLFRVDSIGQPILIEDQFESHFGGVYNAETKTYKFGLTNYLQSTISKTVPDYGLYLMALNTSTRANRVNLHNSAANLGKPKLTIIYTQLK